MAVLTRAREQQATEAGERPLPPQEPELTYSQRVNFNRSGINAKRVMYHMPVESQSEEPRNVRSQKTNFKNPTDFYAGPSAPGRILGGPRRFDGGNQDSVAYMMTDEYQNALSENGYSKPVGGPQHVDNKCFPLHPEPKHRLMVKPIHEQEGLDAPFFEDNNPKPPRDTMPIRNVKSFPERTNQPTGIVFPPPPPSQPTHGNHRNDSKNLLNLHVYTPEQLNEKQPHRVVGPRKWTAPEMDYPKRRPAIRPINSACTECHDVLGTQRFGRRAAAPKRGVAPVDYPYKDQDPLIGFVEPQPQEPRPVKPNTLIRYYDPAVDDASKFTDNEKPRGRAHPAGKRMNYPSNSDYVAAGGKAKGVYGRNNQSSIVLA